ncbi:MAG TPA: hypothetical protein VIK55_18810 [Paludibacter sp.]
MHETLTKAITNGGFRCKFELKTHAPAFVLVDTGKPRTPPLVIASAVSVHAKKEKAENHLIELNQLNK